MAISRFTPLLFCFLLVPLASGYACPDVDGLVDINCDKQVQIIAFGDSITFGRGDSEGLGGYPGRLQLMFPHAIIRNYGDPGEDSYHGRTRAAQVFSRYPTTDYVLILEGVNDWWLENHSAGSTKVNLLSMVRSARSFGSITLLANLTDVRRAKQRSWVLSVNSQINSSRQIDFFSLGKDIVGSDLLHPNAYGYARMAELASATLRQYSEASRPVDTDGDGMYDFAEAWYGSNPRVVDSDGDGLTDGDEVFRYNSSPVALDSDGDGYGDYQEVTEIHSNPGDPRPGPPSLKTLEVLPPL